MFSNISKKFETENFDALVLLCEVSNPERFGIADVKENKLWYKESVIFKETGEYKVNIQHAMRKNGDVEGIDELEGVTDIGFRIELQKID